MFEANNPDIDAQRLNARIDTELQRPPRALQAAAQGEGPQPEDAKAAAAPPPEAAAPGGGGQDPGRHGLRVLHGLPLVGPLIRWIKSLALLTRTRHQLGGSQHRIALLEEQVQGLTHELVSARQKLETALGTGDIARHHARELEQVATALSGRIDLLQRDTDSNRATLDALKQALEARNAETMQRLQEVVHDFEMRLEGVKGEYRGRDDELSSLLRQFADRLNRLADRADLLHGDVLFQQWRLDRLLASPSPAGESAPEAAAGLPAEAVSAVPGRLDQFYEAFEDRFRGSREEIKDRQRIYLDRLMEARAGSDRRPLLDVGCGRGEWLELLQETGLEAYGIDINAMAVEACRAQGLDARTADMMAHLQGLEGGSLGAVTAFHLIEHLPFELLLAFLDEARRTLAPDGLLILETPNPENLLVGAWTFHNDPTHKAPIPPSIGRFMVEQRGFAQAEVWRLHPNDSAERLPEDHPLGARLNQLLFGPQDYAVLARRP